MFDHHKSKDKKPTPPILEFMKEHPTVALTVGYLWLSLIGLVYSASLLRQFEIDILEYFDTGDFFLASFKDIHVIGIALFGFLYTLFFLSLYTKSRNLPDELQELFPGYSKYKYIRLIIISIPTIILPLFNSYLFGGNKAYNIKFGKGDKVYIKLNERTSPIGGGIADGNLSMIGAAGKFIFLYNKEKDVPLIIPMSVISTILVENEQNQALIEKISKQPASSNSELADIKAGIEELAIDHQGMQRDIESLLRKVTCCRPSEGHSSNINAHPDHKEVTNGRPSGGQLLGKVYFEHNSYEIINGQHELESRLLSLPENSNLTVMAFADSTGNSEYNRDLSLRRAIAVRNFIMNEPGMENAAIISSVDGLGEEGAPVQTTKGEPEQKNRVAFIYRTGPDPSSATQGNDSPPVRDDPC